MSIPGRTAKLSSPVIGRWLMGKFIPFALVGLPALDPPLAGVEHLKNTNLRNLNESIFP